MVAKGSDMKTQLKLGLCVPVGVLAALLTACTAPTSETEGSESARPAVDEPNAAPRALYEPGPIPGPGPINCPAITSLTADATAKLQKNSLYSPVQAKGKVDVSDPCDWFVLDLTNSLGGDVLVRALSSSVSSQGVVVPTEAKCTESTMAANVYGQLPSTVTWENGKLVFHPGAWEPIELFTEHGQWASGSATCGFPQFQQLVNVSGPSGIHSDSPYVKIRVATRALLKTAAGTVAGELTSLGSRVDY